MNINDSVLHIILFTKVYQYRKISWTLTSYKAKMSIARFRLYVKRRWSCRSRFVHVLSVFIYHLDQNTNACEHWEGSIMLNCQKNFTWFMSLSRFNRRSNTDWKRSLYKLTCWKIYRDLFCENLKLRWSKRQMHDVTTLTMRASVCPPDQTVTLGNKGMVIFTFHSCNQPVLCNDFV